MRQNAAKKSSTKRTYRNLTYVNMESYIKGNNAGLLGEFESQKKSAKAQENLYRARVFVQGAFPSIVQKFSYLTGIIIPLLENECIAVYTPYGVKCFTLAIIVSLFMEINIFITFAVSLAEKLLPLLARQISQALENL